MNATSYALRDVCSRIDYGLTASASSGGAGPRFLRITDIVNGPGDYSTVPHVDAEPAAINRNILERGDIVVARTGATVGASHWFEGAADPVVFASYLVRFRVREGTNSRYVAYVLRSAEWHSFIRANAHSKSAQPNIGASAMADFCITLPELGVQDHVVEILGSLDDKIATNRNVVSRVLALGEVLARSRASNPTVMTDVAKVVMGTSPKGELLNEEGNGILFYQGVRDFGTLYPSPRVSTVSPVRTAPARATLFAVRAPVGEVNLAIEEVGIGRGLASIFSKERPATLHFCLRAFQKIWDEHQGGGTVFASVNGSAVRNARVPMPEDPSGNLEFRLALLLDRAVQAEQESVRLAATRDELLPLLMSGKITVKDAEKTVEGVL